MLRDAYLSNLVPRCFRPLRPHTGAMSADSLTPGSTLQDGRFVILGIIGRGGQAVTFEAADKQLGKKVTIKRFQVSGAKSWKDVELAEREARVLEALSHPSLPRYIGNFEEAGCLYLVMDYIPGPTLEERRRARTVEQSDVVHFLREMARTLDYLHNQSPPIIHRDIKPRNVICGPDGRFTLVDFGSVRDKLRPEGGSTVVGTFGYMAPEQFQGRAMPATDVYATAATALALLTGREPDQLPHQGLRLDVEAALGSTAPTSLKRLLEQALEPDPDVRGARSLTQLLRAHHLLNEASSSSSRARPPHSASSRSRSSRAMPDERSAPDGIPFHTQGHRRDRKHGWRRHGRGDGRNERGKEVKVPDLERGVSQALRHEGVRNALRMPLVMTLVVLILVLVRTAIWLALAVILPTIFALLHAFFRLPLRAAGDQSLAVARALRVQLRRISKQLRAKRWVDGEFEVSPPATASVHEERTRYRVEADPHPANKKVRNNPERFADELEEEAEKLEDELERSVLSWQGRIGDRKQ